MAQTPQQMAQTMLKNVPDKTGKSVAQWCAILKKSGLDKHGEQVKFLKTDHGVTHGFANLIATLYRNDGKLPGADESALLEAQYAGPKADLRPIYDALITAASKLGKDVEISPKKTCVSLRRNKQFALIQPSTRTRVDLGINLKGTEPDGRLEASGSFNAMVTHRVRLTSPKDVDAQLKRWLKQAYAEA